MMKWRAVGFAIATLISCGFAAADDLTSLRCIVDKAHLKTEEIIEVEDEFFILIHGQEVANYQSLCKMKSFQLVELSKNALEFTCKDEDKFLSLRVSMLDGVFNILSESLVNKDVSISYSGKCHSGS